MTAEEAMLLLNALSRNTTLQNLNLGKICQPWICQFLKTFRWNRLRFTAVYATADEVICSWQGVRYKPASMSF